MPFGSSVTWAMIIFYMYVKNMESFDSVINIMKLQSTMVSGRVNHSPLKPTKYYFL